MTGSSSAVIRASRLRPDRRRRRPTMVGSCWAAAWPEPWARAGIPSDMRASGEGEEDVVEGGFADGEAGDQIPVRVGGLQQGPDVGGTAVGGRAHGQGGRVQVHRGPRGPGQKGAD